MSDTYMFLMIVTLQIHIKTTRRCVVNIGHQSKITIGREY